MRAAASVVLAALLLAGPAWAEVPSRQEIEESLTCQCGCGLTVHSCNHLQCPSGEPMKEEIRRRLDAGESKETILAAFAARYGEKVLSSPTMQGFNWFAWITPFAFVLLAGSVLAVVVRRRVGETAAASAEKSSDASSTDVGSPAMRDRLRRELDEIDREP